MSMETVKVQYAKTHLSTLLKDVERGEEIIISRGDTPIARLVPIHTSAERELGFVSFTVPQTFFEPLSEDELGLWEEFA